MAIRYLSVDWRLDHPDLRADGFFGRRSLCAVDAAFVDPDRIPERWVHDVPPQGDGVRRTDPQRDRGFGRTIGGWVERRRGEADDLLRLRGGILVCRLRPRGEPLELFSAGGREERIDRYSWLPPIALADRQHQLAFPANGRFLARRGDDLRTAGSGHPFEAYLEAMRGRIVYEAVYQDLLSTPIEQFGTVLARNAVGDVVAVEIPYGDGRLILVPPAEGAAPADEADALVSAVRALAERPGYVTAPDWLPAYALPGEDRLVDELAGLSERRAALDAKIDEVRGRLETSERYQRVLFAQGRFAFLPAVADCFRALGFEVDAAGDLLELRAPEGDALVAAQATEAASIGLPPYRALLAAVDRSITEGAGHRKGILVVSGSRRLDPKRRPTEFSPEVLRGCRSQHFCLLTAYALFKLVRRAVSDRQRTADALRRAVLECDGEFREAETR